MMNREQALQWLVDNLKEWPTTFCETWDKKLDGFEWMKADLMTLGEIKFSLVNKEQKCFIEKKDWISSKQPAPLTRGEALAWLVENVKVWPVYKQLEIPPAPNDYFWDSEDYGREINIELFDRKNSINGIGKLEWEKAKQAGSPASNGEGWIEHNGGECPVDSDEKVEVILQGGRNSLGYGREYRWLHCDALRHSNIIKYRIISKKPASNKPSWDDAPDWAKILVQSENGYWNFGSYSDVYEEKKEWHGYGSGNWFSSIIGDKPNPNWRDTLEYRPTAKESLMVQDKQDDELQYAPKNLARIKQLNDKIELAQLSIESMKIELAERNKEVRDVLSYYKFNA